MKSRILDNGEWGGNHSTEWLENNQSLIFAGQLVYEWQLTEILPNDLLLSPVWNGSEWIEGLTVQEINAEKTKKAIEIDLCYTEKIGKIMTKHTDKKTLDENYIVPQEVITIIEQLKNDCNNEILALGITDYTYRQNIPELMTPIEL